MRKLRNLHWPGLALCALLLTLSGCAGSSMNRWTSIVAPATVASGASVPKVQDCIRINDVDTPAKYVCNGKTYTSHELRKLREDAASGAVAIN